MGLFRRSRREAAPELADEERSTINLNSIAGWIDSTSWSGVYVPTPVSTSKALTFSACWTCIDILASAVSKTPIDTLQYQGDARIVVPDPPFVASPSAYQKRRKWLYQLMTSLLTDGNAWGIVTGFDGMMRPTGIDLVAPETVADRRLVDGVPSALVGGVRQQVFPWGDLFHMPGKMLLPGNWVAENVIDKAAATIGSALAAREYGARFFGDGGVPPGIIYSDQMLTKEDAEAHRSSYRRMMMTREPAVFGSGLKFEAQQVDPDDTQFLDLMRFAIEEACRFFRVPPQMAFAAVSGQNVTYSNASQADLSFLKWSVDDYFCDIEDMFSDFITRPKVVRFNRNAFLRMDAETRHRIYDIRLKNGTISVNEVRTHEDESPFEGAEYDQPGIPGTMTGGGASGAPVPN